MKQLCSHSVIRRCESRSNRDVAISFLPPVILRESRFYRDDRRISGGGEYEEILRFAKNDKKKREMTKRENEYF